MNRIHDRKIVYKEFKPGTKVLLFNSCFKLFPGKLKSRWMAYTIMEFFPYGTVEIKCESSRYTLSVNGHHLKIYNEREIAPYTIETISVF